jgi:diguanylate cyclase (GGDEF)-like protein
MRNPFPAAGRDDLSVRVSRELTERLLQGWIPVLVMATAFTMLGGLILEGARDPALAGFYALGCLALAARMTILVAFPHRRAGEALGHAALSGWERLYAAASFVFAAALGAFTARAFAVTDAATGALVTALIFGFAAGIVARLSIRPWIALPSLALAVPPPILVLVLSGELKQQALGLVICLFGLGSLETIRFISRSVTANVMLRHHLTRAAQHDALTGLANRRLLEERLGQALSGEPARWIAVHYLDLDRFKPVNDRFGHAIGDALLKAVVGRLEGLSRPGDLVARVGGDEFVVLQANPAQPGEAELLARRMVRALSLPFDIAGHDIRIGASIGVAIAPGDGRDATTLIASADAALYRAKMGGRNGFAFANAQEPALAS